ncbi:FAD-dependent oxidoreductase [Paenibacillus sp. GCM10023252]|uniref:FAD-dependent oxidoreductase n=1 Tax=Paenibacillus sp. GCM10023252 TaxID=3252649 RepID=UPI00360F9ED1
MTEQLQADIVIIGGSIGGCLAALAAAKSGKQVLWTEETEWIGGQFTSQAVPPDEHKWIEQFGCTRTYREFRDQVREYYRRHYPLTAEAAKQPRLNPGVASVSRLSHEPRVALKVLQDMLAPYMSNGSIKLLQPYRPVDAVTEGDHVQSVTVQHAATGKRITLKGAYFLDATECGDLLPFTGTEYVTGAESRADTGEAHAPETADPQDMQPVTHVAALDYVEGGSFIIDKPQQYEEWRAYNVPFADGHKQLSWYGPDSTTMKSKPFAMFDHERTGLFSLWDYRRVIAADQFQEGFYAGDISLINWPQNDYSNGNVFELSEEERAKHLEGARQLTLSFIYWLQTEAPRPDGGTGYPGLRLRGDVVGTEDGLAMYPYIRESRRIRAEFTVVEEHINAELSAERPRFEDTIGVGCYHMDLHATTRTKTFFYTSSFPFEIPLGSLIPVRMKNLIPACKNIGTTHLTNGCFRLHPVEWNIGEAAGYLAAFAMDRGLTPSEVRSDKNALLEFQALIQGEGIEIHWPEVEAI